MARKRRNFNVIYNGSLEECDEAFILEQSFFKMTPAQKLKASWEMVVHAWIMKGKSRNELRLNRTTSVLKKI